MPAMCGIHANLPPHHLRLICGLVNLAIWHFCLLLWLPVLALCDCVEYRDDKL